MKQIILAVIFLLLLTSCSVFATPDPTQTPAPTSTSTNTPVPTGTKVPTATPQPIPNFLDEFITLGYDKQSFDSDTFYVVLDKQSLTLSSNGNDNRGIRFNKGYITSWMDVYYIQDGLLITRKVITSYSVETPDSTQTNPNYYWYIPFSFMLNYNNPVPITVNWSNGIITELTRKHIDADYPIVQLELNWQSFEKNTKNDLAYFKSAMYPPFDGKMRLVEIPGVGTTIPATTIIADSHP